MAPTDIVPPAKEPEAAEDQDSWPKVKSQDLIFWGTDYVIYVDENGNLNWQTSKKYDRLMAPKDASYNHAKSNSIINQSEFLQATLSDGLPAPVKRQAYDLIGAALTSCFEFDYASAEDMLGIAKKFIDTRNEEIARYWYLSATYAVAAVVGVASLAAFLIGRYFSLFSIEDARWLPLACALGAVGALLSVISRTGRLNFDPAAGRKLHYLEAASRIIAGCLSGLIVYGAIKSGIILSGLFKATDQTAVALLGTFAGGAGERLVSSVITTFDGPRQSPAADTQNKPAPAAPVKQ